jgi:non-specific serine/threonine protein kinase
LAHLSGPAAGHFALRADGLRGLPPRHRRLLDAIGWSYERLPGSEQCLLARLGVFAGGFDLEAASAVCAEPQDPAPAVAAGLAALRARSLIVGAAPRFDLLEAIRHYALERLEAVGEVARLRQRHLEYFAGLAAAAGPHLLGPDQAHWLERLERESPNLRAALRMALDSGQPRRALQLAVDIWRFWHVHAHFAEGQAWLEQALAAAADSAPAGLRASALNAAASLAGSQYQFDVARAYFEQSLALRRALGDQRGVLSSLNNLGLCARNQGDYSAALRFHHESLALARSLGDLPAEARGLNNLGLLALSQADAAGARRYLEAGLSLHRQLGNPHAVASSLQGLGEALARLEAVPAAASAFRESLALYRQLGDWIGVAACLYGLAWVASRQDQLAQAGRLIGAADQIRERIASPVLAFERYLRSLAEQVAPEGLSRLAFDQALLDGRQLAPEQVVAEALAF